MILLYVTIIIFFFIYNCFNELTPLCYSRSIQCAKFFWLQTYKMFTGTSGHRLGVQVLSYVRCLSCVHCREVGKLSNWPNSIQLTPWREPMVQAARDLSDTFTSTIHRSSLQKQCQQTSITVRQCGEWRGPEHYICDCNRWH